MPLQDQISHAASVAKWKVDQQSRILKTQNKLREIENQISAQKWSLAEKTYQLFSTSGIKEMELVEHCQQIQLLYQTLDEMKVVLDSIRAESLPSQSVVDSSHHQVNPITNLICPTCHTPVPVRFCPNCGAEGIANKQ